MYKWIKLQLTITRLSSMRRTSQKQKEIDKDNVNYRLVQGETRGVGGDEGNRRERK